MVANTRFNTIDPERLKDSSRVIEQSRAFYGTILDTVITPWGIVAVCTDAKPARNLSGAENAERASDVIYSIEGYGHATMDEAVLHLMALANGAEINEARYWMTFAYRMRPWQTEATNAV